MLGLSLLTTTHYFLISLMINKPVSDIIIYLGQIVQCGVKPRGVGVSKIKGLDCIRQLMRAAR